MPVLLRMPVLLEGLPFLEAYSPFEKRLLFYLGILLHSIMGVWKSIWDDCLQGL